MKNIADTLTAFRRTALLMIVLAAFTLAGCSGEAAEIFSVDGDNAPVAETGGETGDLMVSSPQRINPQGYNTTFLDRDADHILIDVRTPGEFASGHIDGAININVQELSSRLSEIPQDKPVVLYCRSGNRSAQAAGILNSAGYTGIYDLGGIIDWQAAGYPMVR